MDDAVSENILSLEQSERLIDFLNKQPNMDLSLILLMFFITWVEL